MVASLTLPRTSTPTALAEITNELVGASSDAVTTDDAPVAAGGFGAAVDGAAVAGVAADEAAVEGVAGAVGVAPGAGPAVCADAVVGGWSGSAGPVGTVAAAGVAGWPGRPGRRPSPGTVPAGRARIVLEGPMAGVAGPMAPPGTSTPDTRGW